MSTAANHHRSVTASLRAIEAQEYDWDGSGGLPARYDALLTARDVFGGLYDRHGATLARLEWPEVTPNSNGTVEVAYHEPDTDRQLLLTFECAGVVSYVQAFEDGQTTIEGVLRLGPFIVEAAEALHNLLLWLAGE